MVLALVQYGVVDWHICHVHSNSLMTFRAPRVVNRSGDSRDEKQPRGQKHAHDRTQEQGG